MSGEDSEDKREVLEHFAGSDYPISELCEAWLAELEGDGDSS